MEIQKIHSEKFPSCVFFSKRNVYIPKEAIFCSVELEFSPVLNTNKNKNARNHHTRGYQLLIRCGKYSCKK